MPMFDTDEASARLAAFAKKKEADELSANTKRPAAVRTRDADQSAESAFADTLCERGVGLQSVAMGTRSGEELDKAEYWYREALNEDPNHVGALVRLGVLLIMRKRSSEAEQLLMRSLQVEGDHHPQARRALRVLEVRRNWNQGFKKFKMASMFEVEKKRRDRQEKDATEERIRAHQKRRQDAAPLPTVRGATDGIVDNLSDSEKEEEEEDGGDEVESHGGDVEVELSELEHALMRELRERREQIIRAAQVSAKADDAMVEGDHGAAIRLYFDALATDPDGGEDLASFAKGLEERYCLSGEAAIAFWVRCQFLRPPMPPEAPPPPPPLSPEQKDLAVLVALLSSDEDEDEDEESKKLHNDSHTEDSNAHNANSVQAEGLRSNRSVPTRPETSPLGKVLLSQARTSPLWRPEPNIHTDPAISADGSSLIGGVLAERRRQIAGYSTVGYSPPPSDLALRKMTERVDPDIESLAEAIARKHGLSGKAHDVFREHAQQLSRPTSAITTNMGSSSLPSARFSESGSCTGFETPTLRPLSAFSTVGASIVEHDEAETTAELELAQELLKHEKEVSASLSTANQTLRDELQRKNAESIVMRQERDQLQRQLLMANRDLARFRSLQYR